MGYCHSLFLCLIFLAYITTTIPILFFSKIQVSLFCVSAQKLRFCQVGLWTIGQVLFNTRIAMVWHQSTVRYTYDRTLTNTVRISLDENEVVDCCFLWDSGIQETNSSSRCCTRRWWENNSSSSSARCTMGHWQSLSNSSSLCRKKFSCWPFALHRKFHFFILKWNFVIYIYIYLYLLGFPSPQ